MEAISSSSSTPFFMFSQAHHPAKQIQSRVSCACNYKFSANKCILEMMACIYDNNGDSLHCGHYDLI